MPASRRSGSRARRRSRSSAGSRSESRLQRWWRKNRQRGLTLLVGVLAVLAAGFMFNKLTGDSSVDSAPAEVE